MKKITFLLLLGLTGAANAQNTLTPKEMADLFLKGETIQPGAKLVDSKEKSEVNTKVIPPKNQEKTEVAKPKIEEKKVLSVNSFGTDCKKPEVTKERTTVTKSNFLVNYNVNPKELNKNMLSINMYISKDGQYILPRSLRGYAISEDFRNINIMKPENTKGYLVHGMDFKKKKNEKDYYLVFDFHDGVHNNITYGILD